MKNCCVLLLIAILFNKAHAQTQIGASPIWHLNGLVGIGTQTPSSGLEVTNINGGIHISDYGAYNFLQVGGRSITNGKGFYFRSTTDHLAMRQLALFVTDGGSQQQRLTVDRNGNVGIGIPDFNEARLAVAGANNGDLTLLRLYNNEMTYSAGHGASLAFANQHGQDYGKIGGFTQHGGHGGYGYLSFSTRFEENLFERVRIMANGDVGIGTTDPKAKLAVNGVVRATELKVMGDINLPDYVFEDDYKLISLPEVEKYITKNKHLPEVPSAKEVAENGLELGMMSATLLKKIEELTLYMIEQQKEIERLKKEMKELNRKRKN